MLMIKMKASNDRNGNPRTVYVLYNEHGIMLNAWNEGYRGYDAVDKEYIKLAQNAPAINVTIAQYNEVLQWKKAQKEEGYE